MAPLSIIDSHIHLWPAAAANSDGHSWMTDVKMLATQHVLSDYRRAAKQASANDTSPEVRGVVYIETDRRLGERNQRALTDWANQPTEEIKFLRSILEKHYDEQDPHMLLGLVPWAPMNHGIDVFEQWLKHAEQTAGPETWTRVKGFRFLLQGITDRQAFEDLVFSKDFISILKSFRDHGRNYSFDVAVDQHSGGVWQLEAFAKVIEHVHADVDEKAKTVFIMNHLCKPDLTQAPKTKSEDDFRRWSASIKRFSQFPNVYMKLSGAFSELSDDRVDTSSGVAIADRMKPWLDCVFQCFPPHRIMFGSDWPVCNVRGPAIEHSWSVWKEVVQIALEQRKFSKEDQANIWGGTAVEAYRLAV